MSAAMSRKDGVNALETAEEQTEEQEPEREVYLGRGRSLAISSEGLDDVVEIRAASGMVELRVKLTEEGPVLSLEGVKLSVSAAEDVEVKCRRFTVAAEEAVKIESEGELDVHSEGEMRIESTEDLRARGKKIHLN
jgi:hypothetical protein